MGLRNVNDFSRNFAEAVKQARKKQQLSHEKLAQLSRVSRITISNIESGKAVPTIVTCYKVAAALGMKLSDLIREAE